MEKFKLRAIKLYVDDTCAVRNTAFLKEDYKQEDLIPIFRELIEMFEAPTVELKEEL